MKNRFNYIVLQVTHLAQTFWLRCSEVPLTVTLKALVNTYSSDLPQTMELKKQDFLYSTSAFSQQVRISY